ncbi:hypothetical protein [Gordonia alkaliphila]|uniref:Uncharacterized protein n=1 Tax=Gordonia alkaliphila TaxID=1053547 RepID=A0ABP8Z4N9_9ACTN
MTTTPAQARRIEALIVNGDLSPAARSMPYAEVMEQRASACAIDRIALLIRVTNAYSHAQYTHDLAVSVDAPAADVLKDPEFLDDWAAGQLLPYTGEGPEYASTHATYYIEVLTAPMQFAQLAGYEYVAEG